MRRRSTPSLVVVALSVVFAAMLLSGCARAQNTGTGVTPTASVEPTRSAVPTGPAALQPATNPESAVAAYLGVVTRAYYSLDSTLVAPFVTPGQWVREDAYIQLNLVQNQAIEMNLLSFDITALPAVSADDTATTLVAAESWKWRYWDLKTRKPKTEWTETSYSVEYTVAREKQGWLVDRTRVIEQSGETTPTPVP